MENISNKLKIAMIITILIPIIMLFLFLIGLSKVEAETTTNGLNYTQLKYYTGNTLITTLNVDSTNNNVYYFNGSGQLSNNWQLRSTSAYTIENNQIVLFNIRIRYTPNTAVNYPNINSINFAGQSCFYMVTNNQEINSSLNDTYFSVICLMNSTVTITSGTTLISFNSDPVLYSTVAISGITYVNNLNAYNLLQTELATANIRLLDLNYRGQYIYETLLREETSLSTLITNTDNIFTRLTWINTLLENIQGYISNGNTQAHTDHQEIMNEDIDATTKQQVDSTNINDYNTKEANLMNTATQTNLNDVSIGIDSTASGNIWQLVTRLLNTNTKVFGLVISILSIGIIKLMLAR